MCVYMTYMGATTVSLKMQISCSSGDAVAERPLAKCRNDYNSGVFSRGLILRLKVNAGNIRFTFETNYIAILSRTCDIISSLLHYYIIRSNNIVTSFSILSF